MSVSDFFTKIPEKKIIRTDLQCSLSFTQVKQPIRPKERAFAERNKEEENRGHHLIIGRNEKRKSV